MYCMLCVCVYVCRHVCTKLCMYVCVYMYCMYGYISLYLCMYMYVVMKVRSNCAIHNRINYFNENITCIHYIIIVLLGLYSDTKFH